VKDENKVKEQLINELVKMRQRIIHLEKSETNHKQLEEKIKHLNLVLLAIQNINRLITKEKDRDRLLQRACNNLVENRGYYNAWIALFDKSGGLVSTAESDLGKAFLPMIEKLKCGEMANCGRRALKQSDVVVIKDPISTCTDCPLSAMYSSRGAMAVRLENEGEVYGILSASIPRGFVSDEKERALFKEVASDIAFALHKLELDKAQCERAKEQNCLNSICDLLVKQNISLEEIFQRVIYIMPPAWQYPEITCVRITLKDQEFKTDDFRETVWRQTRNIIVHSECIGSLDVCLLEERPESDGGPFMKEEKNLLNSISNRLEVIIENKWMEEELKKHREHLEELVEERTAQIITINEQLKQEITERRQAEKQCRLNHQKLIQADKLSSLGGLVAGVAHEINNPNQSIMLNGNLVKNIYKGIMPILEKYYKENGDFSVGGLTYSEIREKISFYLSGILDGVKRIDNIVTDLRKFVLQDQEGMLEKVNINVVVRASITLVSNLVKKSTNKFIVELASELPKIKSNYQRLEQVIVNLIQNACHALPNRKKGIFISTSYDKEKDSIVIKVEDEGVGISPENLSKIQDPFFTTKRNSGGTGLGLAISSRIIEDHHGKLEFLSELGKGTNVLITLPIFKTNMETER